MKFHEFNIFEHIILVQPYYCDTIGHILWCDVCGYIVLLKCLAWRGLSLPWQICGFRVDTGEGKIGKRHCAYVCFYYFPLQLGTQFSWYKNSIDKKNTTEPIFILSSLSDNNSYIILYIIIYLVLSICVIFIRHSPPVYNEHGN